MDVKPTGGEERTFEIVNALGLHARAAALLVQTAQKYRCEIEVLKEDIAVNGKSIMGILMLAAAKGSRVTVRAVGEDACDALEGIGDLIRNGFWEKE
ncbi:MAG: HPr family phosphocarrier protein [Proteobacteria bacterium]|nr:HPr family phosphocarrier protein [Pseudomonadota bacterium]